MITRTFITKNNSIFENSDLNHGLCPVLMLNCGNVTSRALIYFDTDKLQSMVEDGTYQDMSKLKHVLKMTNYGSLSKASLGERLIVREDSIDEFKQRASSFDVYAFKVPCEWDEGVGFDAIDDFWTAGKGVTSDLASSWYCKKSGNEWDNEGIYPIETLANEYLKFGNKEDSIVVGYQHFDHGNEDLAIDITDYVNSIIYSGETNYGLCLAFSPASEYAITNETMYVGFFGRHTNTIFEPYVETTYDSVILDDRYHFVLGKKNRLYLYSYIGGVLCDLDEMPVCTILDEEYEVHKQTKGVYYVDVKLSPKEHEPDELIYDVWSNLKYQGDDIDDTELNFATLASSSHFGVGASVVEPKTLSVSVQGINDSEKINQGDVRPLKVIFKVPYTTSDYEFPSKSFYRIYVKDGEREVDIIPWEPINQMGMYNSIIVDTNQLLPAEYHVDIKGVFGYEERMFKNKLAFTVVNNVSFYKK